MDSYYYIGTKVLTHGSFELLKAFKSPIPEIIQSRCYFTGWGDQEAEVFKFSNIFQFFIVVVIECS